MRRETLGNRLLAACLLVVSCFATPLWAGNTITELFISEYIEGSSFNKAIEIYNGTGSPVDLAAGNFTLEVYFNGSASPGDTLNLTGTVADGDVVVVANSGANAGIMAETDIVDNAINFNGDDAVVLKKNGIVIDAIGQIGFDPGSEWGSGNTSTQNNTIVRNADVCSGESDASDVFDPSIEWTGFASNTITDLGSHTTSCGSGAGAVVADCNSPAATAEGQALVHPVSSTDADGTVVNLEITQISPSPSSGSITLANLVAAGAVGGTATADIVITDQVPIGNYMVTILATNDDPVAETGECTLIVKVSGLLTIAEIQGTPANQGPNGESPFAGLSIQTTGIVTGVKTGGFFMQMSPGDGDDQSSDGIYVFTGDPPAVTVAVGDEVQVNGEIIEFFGLTEYSGGSVVTVLNSGNPLPPPITLTAQFPDPAKPLLQLERVEAMRVSMTDATITTPGRLSFGVDNFYAVTNGTPRNLREPGLEAPDFPNLPLFDLNPEAIRIDMNQLLGAVSNGALPHPAAGQTATATGPLDFAFGEFRLLAEDSLVIGGSAQATPIRDTQSGEFTVASFNMQFLDSSNVTKTQKASKAILDVLKAPDIVALQEVVNQAALDALAAQITVDDPSVVYTAMVPADSDTFEQEVAYLIKDTVSGASFSEFGIGLTYLNSGAGCSPETLHNRPPYILDCTVTPPGGQAYDLTVVNLHLRSLSRIDDPNQGERVRMKRFLAARTLAAELQSMQAGDPNRRILVVGDFNDFAFTDGFVDVVGIIAGTPDFDLIESNTYPEILSPKLLPLSSMLPSSQQYSFVFGKNAQQLDHILATGNFGCDISGLAVGRLNADFPFSVFENDASRPERTSDHDPPVVFIQTAANSLPVIAVKDRVQLEGTTASQQFITFSVSLCSASTQMVTVDWSLLPGLAQPGDDYVETTGTVTFLPGSTEEFVQVEIVGDGLKETNEDFFLSLTNPFNAVIGDPEGSATLIDDDNADALKLAIAPALLRPNGDLGLKAWPTGGSGLGTYSFQWEDVTPSPMFVFDPDANPVIIDMVLPNPSAFRVTVDDLLGNTTSGTSVIGDAVAILADLWNRSAPDFEWDGDDNFTVADWAAIVNFSQQTDNAYPCDP